MRLRAVRVLPIAVPPQVRARLGRLLRARGGAGTRLRAAALPALAWLLLPLPAASAEAAPGGGGSGTRRGIEIASPQDLQILQRGAGDRARVRVLGRCWGDATAIRVSFRGSTQDLDASPACADGGSFRGTLTLAGPAQGPLRAFFSNDAAIFHEVRIAVGDVFVIAGQSNAVGLSPTKNTSQHPTRMAVAFSRTPRRQWRRADDPLHNLHHRLGSAWPHFATILMADANAGVPIGFVTTAVAGSSLVASPTECWDPAPQSGCTLYAGLLAQFEASGVGGARAVLYFQGETDAELGVPEQTYRDALERLGARVETDLGVPMVIGQTGRYLTVPEANLEAIRKAQRAAVLEPDNNIFGGFPTSDLRVWDAVHFGDAGAIALAERFCREIDALLYGGSFASCSLADYAP